MNRFFSFLYPLLLTLLLVGGLYLLWDSISPFWQKIGILAILISTFFLLKDLLSGILGSIFGWFSSLFMALLAGVLFCTALFFGYKGLEQNEVKQQVDELINAPKEFVSPKKLTDVTVIGDDAVALEQSTSQNDEDDSGNTLDALLSDSSTTEPTRKETEKNNDNTEEIDPLVALLSGNNAETQTDKNNKTNDTASDDTNNNTENNMESDTDENNQKDELSDESTEETQKEVPDHLLSTSTLFATQGSTLEAIIAKESSENDTNKNPEINDSSQNKKDDNNITDNKTEEVDPLVALLSGDSESDEEKTDKNENNANTATTENGTGTDEVARLATQGASTAVISRETPKLSPTIEAALSLTPAATPTPKTTKNSTPSTKITNPIVAKNTNSPKNTPASGAVNLPASGENDSPFVLTFENGTILEIDSQYKVSNAVYTDNNQIDFILDNGNTSAWVRATLSTDGTVTMNRLYN